MKKDDSKPQPGVRLASAIVLAPVTSLAEVKKAREAEDFAPLELFEPVAIKLQGDDYQITACDGEQTYVWLATKKPGKAYRVVETFPGMSKRSTLLRSVKNKRDLVLLGTSQTIEEVVEEIAEVIFADLEEVGTGTDTAN
jgi:hypothetical protein